MNDNELLLVLRGWRDAILAVSRSMSAVGAVRKDKKGKALLDLARKVEAAAFEVEKESAHLT